MPTSSPPTAGRRPAAARRQADLGAITFVLAAACGLAVANIYFAQPLLNLLARSFHTGDGAVTVVMTVTQIGYAAGLFLLLPLGDLFENRKLTSGMLVVTAAALALAGSAPWLGDRGRAAGPLRVERHHALRRRCRDPGLPALGMDQGSSTEESRRGIVRT